MKKIFLFAAAAMVSLSGCVKTDEVYTGGVQEMIFKSAVVRGAIEGNTFTGSMTVAGAWDAEKDGTYVEYFEPTKFVDAAGVWSGEPARYWPNTGNMDFLAYYPYGVGTLTATYNANKLAGLSVTGIVNEAAQHDVLFSDRLTVEAPQASPQALYFHHALAQLKVTFATNLEDEEVKIVSVTVANVVFDGDLTVTAGATSTAAWSNTSTPKNFAFANTPAGNLTDAANAETTPLLIVPTGTQTEMTIVYTLNGHQQTKDVDLSGYAAWAMGNKYIYNFTIGAKEIQFTCEVDEWDDVVVSGGNITI